MHAFHLIANVMACAILFTIVFSLVALLMPRALMNKFTMLKYAHNGAVIGLVLQNKVYANITPVTLRDYLRRGWARGANYAMPFGMTLWVTVGAMAISSNWTLVGVMAYSMCTFLFVQAYIQTKHRTLTLYNVSTYFQ